MSVAFNIAMQQAFHLANHAFVIRTGLTPAPGVGFSGFCYMGAGCDPEVGCPTFRGGAVESDVWKNWRR
jgi:hypothetical protein